MASTDVTLAPLNEVRDAIYARLAASNLGTDVSLASEAGQVDMPFVSVGAAYKGEGSTETLLGVSVIIVQVDCFASSVQGGAYKAGQMARAVATALSVQLSATIDDVVNDIILFKVEDDVLQPNMQDEAGGPVYAMRYVRFRFGVSQ